MEKRIIILGAIGNTERQNRDNARVLGGGGTIYTLKSHIATDKPLVVRKWERQEYKDTLEQVDKEEGYSIGGGCSATILGTEYKEPQKVIKKWIRK
jgi:hypothetical protein